MICGFTRDENLNSSNKNYLYILRNYQNMNMSMGEIFSVTEFNTLVKEVVKELGVFKIRGEVTELTITQRKGVYITLSDGKSNIKVSGYAPTINGIDLIEKGMDVVVDGRCDIYVPYGSFSFSATNITPEGEGALAIAYQKLKDKLTEEGLFNEESKLGLPKFITKIALLTGKASAAYSDFSKILTENSSGIIVDYYPVIVQGEKSIGSILAAFETCKSKDYDAIVLTRGGGSLEDLKSFNDEGIARTVFLSRIPVLVGVGHEKDESICDFVADKRASTPSQCSYYLVEQNRRFIDEQINKLENIRERIVSQIRGINEEGIMKINIVESSIQRIIEKYNSDIDIKERLLKSFDINTVLKRGFSIVESKGKQIKSVKNLNESEEVKIIFSDGSATATVKSKK